MYRRLTLCPFLVMLDFVRLRIVAQEKVEHFSDSDPFRGGNVYSIALDLRVNID